MFALSDHTEVEFFLIDDCELDGEVFRRAMRRNEIDRPVHFVSDPTVAIDAIRKHRLDEPHVQLIIFLDLNMPGINGHELLAEIRKDADLAPLLVFILTTSDHERDVRQAYQRNVAGYFTKSRVDGLMQTIKPFCDSVVFPQV